MDRTAIILLTLALAGGLFACNSGSEARRAEPQAAVLESAQPAPSGALPPSAAACGAEATACGAQTPTGCSQAAEAGCGCGSEPAATDRVESGTDPATGRPMQVVGAPLSGAERVSVSQLLANPEAFAGKTVRLEGDVAAMCHHKRRWFAVQDPGDRSGRTVRVLAAPAFLVPPQSIGRRARAEGTVELIDLPAATSRHLAQQHGLTDEPAGPQKQLVLRALGAELI